MNDFKIPELVSSFKMLLDIDYNFLEVYNFYSGTTKIIVFQEIPTL